MSAAFLSEVEDEVQAVVDKLGVLEVLLDRNPGSLAAHEIRAITRLVGDAACGARGIEVDLKAYRAIVAEPDAGRDDALIARQAEVNALRALIVALDARIPVAAPMEADDHRSDSRAAEVATRAAVDLMIELRAEIAAMPARTLAGLRFKATLAAPGADDHHGASQVIMASIVADLLALENSDV